MSSRASIIGCAGYALLLASQIASLAVTGTVMMQRLLVMTPSSSFTPLISYIAIIATVLIGVGWILLGRYVKSGLLTATGILFIVSTAMLGISIGYAARLAMRTGMFYTKTISPTMASMYIQLAVLSMAASVLYLVTFVLHIISHFIAGRRTGIGMFKIAGILHAITLSVGLGVTAYMMYFIMTRVQMLGPMGLLAALASPTFKMLMLVMLANGVIGIAAIALSAISFFLVKAK